MRRLLALPALASIVLAIAACSGGGSGPGWTLGPSPSAEPSASASGSAQPSGSASVQPSASASASAQPSGSPSGATVEISAAAVAFEQPSVEIPADTAFTIHFDNKDVGQLHNVEIKDGGGASLFRGEIVTGPAEIDYAVTPIPAGSYTFICSVHPNMTGTMTAS